MRNSIEDPIQCNFDLTGITELIKKEFSQNLKCTPPWAFYGYWTLFTRDQDGDFSLAFSSEFKETMRLLLCQACVGWQWSSAAAWLQPTGTFSDALRVRNWTSLDTTCPKVWTICIVALLRDSYVHENLLFLHLWTVLLHNMQHRLSVWKNSSFFDILGALSMVLF